MSPEDFFQQMSNELKLVTILIILAMTNYFVQTWNFYEDMTDEEKIITTLLILAILHYAMKALTKKLPVNSGRSASNPSSGGML